MMAEQEETEYREVGIAEGQPVKEVLHTCGRPLTLFLSGSTGWAEVTLRCDACQVDYVAEFNADL